MIQGGKMISGVLATLSVIGRILDQLVEIGALDHLAGGGGEVAADLERAGIDLSHLPLGDVREHVLEAFEQILALGLDDLLEHLGVGRGEIGGADRIDQTLGSEADLLLLLVVDSFDRLDVLHQVIGDHEIALAQEIEHRFLAPLRSLEALVARLRGGLLETRGMLGVEEALPQLHRIGPEVRAGAHRRGGIEQRAERRRGRGVLEHVHAVLEHHLLRATEHPGPVLELLEAGGRGFGLGHVSRPWFPCAERASRASGRSAIGSRSGPGPNKRCRRARSPSG